MTKFFSGDANRQKAHRFFASLALALCLLSFVGRAEAADNWSGDTAEVTPGSGDVYEISTPQQLAWIAEVVNDGTENFSGKTVKLMKDIDLAGKEWTPIGWYDDYDQFVDYPFKGAFDGKGHVISNLYIDADTDYQGLFGAAVGAEIKNVGLADVKVTGKSGVGGLIGGLDFGSPSSEGAGGTIISCYVTGSVTGKGDYVGGLAGGSTGTITFSCATGSVTGSVTGTGGSVGGLVGMSGGTITSCYATGSVTGTGGFVGLNIGEINSCCFDTQGTGQTDGVGATEKGGSGTSDALATSEMTGASLPGALPDGDWMPKPGYYPQLKAFADDPATDMMKAASALSVVPVLLAASEDVKAVKSSFEIPAVDALGNTIAWTADDTVDAVLDIGSAQNPDGMLTVGVKKAGSVKLTAATVSFDKTFALVTEAGTTPPDVDPTPPDEGDDPTPPAPSDASADVTAASVIIDGTTYQGAIGADGGIGLDLPGGTDISNLDIKLGTYAGAKVEPRGPYDFTKQNPITITVTSANGTKKTYTIAVTVAPAPPVDAAILNALPESATAALTQNADGTWNVEFRIPYDANFDPSDIATAAAKATGLDNIKIYAVDANGSETLLQRGASPHLKITGTAADKAALADVTLHSVSVWKTGDDTEYKQSLSMKLADVPGGSAEETAPGGSGGNSSGCDAGLGMTAFALIGATMAVRRKRR